MNYPDLIKKKAMTESWQGLWFYWCYRLFLASLIAFSYFSQLGPSFLGRNAPKLFELSSAAYLLVVIFFGVTLVSSSLRFSFKSQVVTQVLSDVLFLTLLMFTSGGVQAGIGLLIVASTIFGSLLLPGIMALFFAAAGTLAVLGQELVAHWLVPAKPTAYTHAGMLGVAFFATGMLALTLAKRLKETTHLAQQTAQGVVNLSRLNERVISWIPSGILVVDNLGAIQYANDNVWQLLGVDVPDEGALLNESCDALNDSFVLWKKNPNRENLPFRVSGSLVELLPRFSRQKDASGEVVLIMIENYSEQLNKIHQQQLASLGRLSANVAHEVRNPLGAISHAAQLLAESESLTADDHELVDIVVKQSLRMDKTIDTVLQASRRSSPQRQALDLSQWVGGYLSELAFQEPRYKEVRFVPGLLFKQAVFDPAHLQQILVILLNNALEYGISGSSGIGVIEVETGMVGKSATPYVEVKDYGPGVPSHLRRVIFEPFFTTGANGTGQGLYLAKALCDLNRASLEYESTWGKGACFRLLFPEPSNEKK